MTNADMVLAWIGDDGNPIINDYWSTGRKPPQPDTVLGGSNDVEQPLITRANGITHVTFQRAMDTGDPFDKVLLKQAGRVSMMFAWRDGSPGDLSFHGANNMKMVACYAKEDDELLTSLCRCLCDSAVLR